MVLYGTVGALCLLHAAARAPPLHGSFAARQSCSLPRILHPTPAPLPPSCFLPRSHLIPVYEIEPLEKITDAYLDQARREICCLSFCLVFAVCSQGQELARLLSCSVLYPSTKESISSVCSAHDGLSPE